MQQKTWEKEYSNPQLVTGTSNEPIADVERFVKWYKKKVAKPLGLAVLDLGSGNGKNGNYLARLGAQIEGIDIARNAVDVANKIAKESELSATYRQGSIGDNLPFSDGSFDMAIDATASNSLTETERAKYLTETARCLKPGGHFFVRVLTKDGDKNAKNLLKLFPGKEHDTYIMPGVGLIERVWTEADFREYYKEFFNIIFLEKREHYTRFAGQKYKRHFLIAYLVKK
ncbi:MAG: class I SAM-dependent methyltransferase [bacterium]